MPWTCCCGNPPPSTAFKLSIWRLRTILSWAHCLQYIRWKQVNQCSDDFAPKCILNPFYFVPIEPLFLVDVKCSAQRRSRASRSHEFDQSPRPLFWLHNAPYSSSACRTGWTSTVWMIETENQAFFETLASETRSIGRLVPHARPDVGSEQWCSSSRMHETIINCGSLLCHSLKPGWRDRCF